MDRLYTGSMSRFVIAAGALSYVLWGQPIPATHSKLSEHNIEWLRTQPAQTQAEFLLGAAVNHDEGATDRITQMVEGWRGKLKRTR